MLRNASVRFLQSQLKLNGTPTDREDLSKWWRERPYRAGKIRTPQNRGAYSTEWTLPSRPGRSSLLPKKTLQHEKEGRIRQGIAVEALLPTQSCVRRGYESGNDIRITIDSTVILTNSTI